MVLVERITTPVWKTAPELMSLLGKLFCGPQSPRSKLTFHQRYLRPRMRSSESDV